jgi:hypothetical protein
MKMDEVLGRRCSESEWWARSASGRPSSGRLDAEPEAASGDLRLGCALQKLQASDGLLDGFELGQPLSLGAIPADVATPLNGGVNSPVNERSAF